MDENIISKSSPGSVIVVEDDIITLKLLALMLSDAGYEVRSAESADMALKLVNEKLPSLMMIDIIMPGMGGYELCKILKGDEKTSLIPVVFCSGLSGEDDKAKAFAAGGIDYITKPYDFPKVVERVKGYFKTIIKS